MEIISTQKEFNTIPTETEEVYVHTRIYSVTQTKENYLCCIALQVNILVNLQEIVLVVARVQGSWRVRPIQILLNTDVLWRHEASGTSYLEICSTSILQIWPQSWKIAEFEDVAMASSARSCIIHTRLQVEARPQHSPTKIIWYMPVSKSRWSVEKSNGTGIVQKKAGPKSQFILARKFESSKWICSLSS